MTLLFAAAPPPRGGGRIDPAQTRVLHQWRHPRALIGCRFDPSGRFLFASSEDNNVVRWTVADGRPTVLAGHRSWVRALAFAPRHNLFYSGDWAGQLLAWPIDAAAPTPTRTVAAHRGWVPALAISPDGQTLASCGNDRLVKLWSAGDGRHLRTFEGHESHVYNVAFHPSGTLVSADLKGVVKVWDMARGAVAREMDAKVLHKYDAGFGADIGGVRSMAFSADGALLACAGITNVSNAFAGVGNPLVVLFDYATGRVPRPRVNFQGTAWGVDFLPSGHIVGVGGGNGGAFWAWRADQPLASFTFPLPSNARDLALHPDNRRFAVPFETGFVRVYDMGPR